MADLSQFTDEELRKFAAGETNPIASMSDEELRAIAGQGKASAGERARAVPAGFNTGALTYLPGLPVKAGLDVVDLLKSGLGTAMSAFGVPGSKLPQLTNREQIPMSPEWIQARIRNAGGGNIIDLPRPDDPASRILYSAGSAVGAFPARGSIGKQAVAGGISQGAIEAGASPELAAIAGMAPFAGAARNPPPPKQPILTPEQQMLRQDALNYGYELTPAQQSGKQWQTNLEAVMRQAPTTSGRMQAIDARNAIRTNQLVEDAVNAAGGAMDQGTAGAAAFNAMREGIAKQAKNTGTAYKNLLGNVPVDLTGQIPTLQQIVARQQKLPEAIQGGTALSSAQDLVPYITKNPVVSGEVAQDMRSGYRAQAQSTTDAQQAGIYRDMKKSVDKAIEQSVPAAKQGEFAALNAKYGYDKAIQSLEPKSQEQFLAQLYRGSPDQFYTFLGVADPASFSTTARGFITRLVEKARKDETGNVSARKLGGAIDALNPDASGRADVMKHFGGPADKTLRDVGNIGQNVLPEAVGNPGTAQRLFYNMLLRGGGLAGGGVGAGIGAMTGGGAEAALGSMAGGLLGNFIVPMAVQGAYLSPKMRATLVNGKPPYKALTPEELLLQKYGGLLGYSAVAP